jgi:hypothetical protein
LDRRETADCAEERRLEKRFTAEDAESAKKRRERKERVDHERTRRDTKKAKKRIFRAKAQSRWAMVTLVDGKGWPGERQ